MTTASQPAISADSKKQESRYDQESVLHPHGNGLIAVAAFSCLVVALQQTLVVPATPRFPQLLGESATAVSWIVTATLLTGAIATPIISKLSDMVGRRKMLVFSMTFVLIGSVIAPLGGLLLVVAGRALQGLGTALVPVAMAQMRDSLPPHKIGSSLAILSATLGVGGGIGIPIGGVIISIASWQWLFWVSAALSVVSIVLIALVVPQHNPETHRPFDTTGAVLLSIGLVSLLLGISQGGMWGWGSLPTVLTLVLGVLVLVVWTFFELRNQAPLVDLRSSAIRPVLLTHISSFTMGILMFTNLLLTTQQLQGATGENGFGWSAQAAGLAMLPNACAMFLVAPLTAHLAKRFSPQMVLGLGAVVTGLGYLLRIFLIPNGAMLIVWTTVIGIGVGIGYAALPMLIVRYTPGTQIGEANGMNALVRAIGTAVASAGVSVIATMLAVTVEGHSTPSATAFLVLSIIGAVISAATLIFALGARSEKHRVHQA